MNTNLQGIISGLNCCQDKLRKLVDSPYDESSIVFNAAYVLGFLSGIQEVLQGQCEKSESNRITKERLGNFTDE